MIYIKPYIIDLSQVLYIQVRGDRHYNFIIEFRDHSRLYSDDVDSSEYENIKSAIIRKG